MNASFYFYFSGDRVSSLSFSKMIKEVFILFCFGIINECMNFNTLIGFNPLE